MRGPRTLVLRRPAAASPPSPMATCAAAHASPRLCSEDAGAAVGVAACWEPAAGAAGAPRAEGAAEGAAQSGRTYGAAQRRAACSAAGEGDRGRPAVAAAVRGRQWPPWWEAAAPLAACHSQISAPTALVLSAPRGKERSPSGRERSACPPFFGTSSSKEPKRAFSVILAMTASVRAGRVRSTLARCHGRFAITHTHTHTINRSSC